jgi:carbonic anhydrase
VEILVSIDLALNKLKEGNKRFIENKFDGNISVERRIENIQSQHPFATILGCSDSRVPIELIFDQGIGDLFIVRTAGNIIDSVSLGSLEYGGAHLNTPIMMVLGHQNCGAVAAAVKGDPLPGSMQKIIDNIKPAVDACTENACSDEGLLEDAIRMNIDRVIKDIKENSLLLKERIDNGVLKLIGGYYSLETGEVEFLI